MAWKSGSLGATSKPSKETRQIEGIRGGYTRYWGIPRTSYGKVRKVLHRMAEHGLHLDPDKSEFAQKVKYLGFIIVAGVGNMPDPERIRAITQVWRLPFDGCARAIRSSPGRPKRYAYTKVPTSIHFDLLGQYGWRET
jgi:hypothetical protein